MQNLLMSECPWHEHCSSPPPFLCYFSGVPLLFPSNGRSSHGSTRALRQNIHSNMRTSYGTDTWERHQTSAFFFIAVFHGDALQSTTIGYRNGGFFYCETAMNCVVSFTV
uniref:Uncharacterized protein n=1 Tax=Micrurus paraensis TaxID=1970185 RepID=A0A2D4KS85_9SAUR